MQNTTMLNRRWLFVLILAVPVVGFGVAEAIKVHFNLELRSVLHRQYPNADPHKLSEVTVDRLCETPDQALHNLCMTNTILNLMRGGAVGAAIAGLGLLVLIWFAGRLARRDRNLLLILFRPGLYVTAVVLTGLVLVDAAVAIGAIYYGESALLERVHMGIIAAIGVGALVGVTTMARNAFSLVKDAQTVVLGKHVEREEAPQLWGLVEETAERMGALRPEHVVVGLDPNFFVTEATVTCLDGSLSGRTLYCSLPLCRILSVGELTSVIGHELGHFKGLDTKFSVHFYPIYRGTMSSIVALRSAGGRGSSSIALLPAIAVLSYFLECFAMAESALSRERELAADQEGAAVTDAATSASALVKVHAFAGIWEELRGTLGDSLKEGKVIMNASQSYADAVARSAGPRVLEGIADRHLSHPTDTHPPLSVRLQSLGKSLEEVSVAALAVRPKEAGIALISEFEQKEKEVSEAYQAILARQFGIDLEAARPEGKKV